MYPVARQAIYILEKSEDIPRHFLADMLTRARSTEDIWLMRELLQCVVKHGDNDLRLQVIEMTRRGSRVSVGRAAAQALFFENDKLDDECVAAIIRSIRPSAPASIVATLILIVGERGSPESILDISNELAATEDRRVFLALLAFTAGDQDAGLRASVASKLPEGHPARRWAEGEDIEITQEMLIDLGDAAAVKATKGWIPDKNI